MDCPFCPIEKKTTWFYDGRDKRGKGIVVCEDLNPADFDLRILAVMAGAKYHIPAYGPCWLNPLIGIGRRETKAFLEDHPEFNPDYEMDMICGTTTDHFHIQFCLRLR